MSKYEPLFSDTFIPFYCHKIKDHISYQYTKEDEIKLVSLAPLTMSINFLPIFSVIPS
jgi:hypothetical protein